jgi:hypothetical protein
MPSLCGMTDLDPPFRDPAVARAFAGFPAEARPGLHDLRALIFEVAAATPEAGPIVECLKWGQPAYLTAETKSGSTIRLGVPRSGGFALYTHCRTTLLSDFRHAFGDDFTYEGNRAIHFVPGVPLPRAALAQLIRAALTYRLKPQPSRARSG